MRRPAILTLLVISSLAASSCGRDRDEKMAVYDLVIRDAVIYDGRGGPGRVGSLAVDGERIAAVGDLGSVHGHHEIDARGLALAPGFINMLSWATETLLEDGRAQSDVLQGVTLEVFGEGWSMGPVDERMRAEILERQDDIRYSVPWTTLGEYLEHLEARGISPNVASFVGASTVRIHELGYADREPTAEELGRMQELVRQAMAEGALGVGSSLIYAPAFYATTGELTALAQAAGEYGGMYVSHLRSEGDRFLEALDEFLTIAREADVPAEVYHLKAAGRDNWPKLTAAIERIETARAAGLRITANVYPYTAGATGLDAAMPPWVMEGGHDAWLERLRDPVIRDRVLDEMRTPSDTWENLLIAAGSAENVLLVGFRNSSLHALIGRTLGEVAKARGTTPEDAALDLVIEDDGRVETVYFMMSEDNVSRKIRQPWVSFGSDAGAPGPEGVFLDYRPHPRAYGTFARVLGHYVREEKTLSLAEAIRRMTSLPAQNLSLRERGVLEEGFYADLVIFDPERVRDRSTYEDPHRLAEGVEHVLINGTVVVRGGAHTGAVPGKVVRGPGWTGWKENPVKTSR